MKNKRSYSFLLLFSLVLLSCNGQQSVIPKAITDAAPMHIQRFDKDLFSLISASSSDTTREKQFSEQYPGMLKVLGQGILNMQSVSTPGFFNRLINYYSEPTLNGLYRDALQKYEKIDTYEQQLGNAFSWIQKVFPDMPLPKVYMHVSGFNQNILIGDNLISISIDKYLGNDYKLYKDYFYDAQRWKMTPERIVPDYVTGWLMSEFPFAGKENVLLDRMIYAGKIFFIVHNALPDIAPEILLGYQKKDYDWCKEQTGNIWRAIIQHKHLYTPDRLVTDKYFDDMPSQFLASDAPGNIGTFMGWQIVEKYMSKTHSSIEQLMKNESSQEILTASEFKP